MKKILINLVLFFSGLGIGGIIVKKRIGQSIEIERRYSNKHLSLFKMMSQWVRIKQEGKKIESYFERENIKEIAIYGMSYAGRALVEELAGSKIAVKYAIDRNANNILSDIDIIEPEDLFDKVDAIVVTAIQSFEEIKKTLSEKIDCPILSLENILYEI